MRLVLVLGVMGYLLLGLLRVLLTSAPALRGVTTLTVEQVFRYAQTVENEDVPVDAVLLPPFAMDGDRNLSLASVQRFLPWVRRVHIWDPRHVSSGDPLQYWTTHQHAPLVFFQHDLLAYSLTSPFLAERFVLVQPHMVLSNYAFLWQFFVGESPVVRSCSAGVLPFTRTIFNECAYATTDDRYTYAVQRGVMQGWIRYGDNPDHFVPPCAAVSSVPTVTRLGAHSRVDQVIPLLQFQAIHQDRDTRPLRIVVGVVAAARDDWHYPLPAEYASCVQVWVHLVLTRTSFDERLSFLHRTTATHNVGLEVEGSDSSERMGANAMRQLHRLSRQAGFQVLRVFSYGLDSAPLTSARLLANQTGNKLARAYQAPFAPFSVPAVHIDEREHVRLGLL